jgi:hypothetical protein
MSAELYPQISRMADLGKSSTFRVLDSQGYSHSWYVSRTSVALSYTPHAQQSFGA